MRNIIFEKAIVGLPKLNTKEGKVGGGCQIQKQTKISHTNVLFLFGLAALCKITWYAQVVFVKTGHM